MKINIYAILIKGSHRPAQNVNTSSGEEISSRVQTWWLKYRFKTKLKPQTKLKLKHIIGTVLFSRDFFSQLNLFLSQLLLFIVVKRMTKSEKLI